MNYKLIFLFLVIFVAACTSVPTQTTETIATRTAVYTNTPSPAPTLTHTHTPTASPTSTPTPTATATNSPTSTYTLTPTNTPSSTPIPTETFTPIPPTATLEPTNTPMPTPTEIPQAILKAGALPSSLDELSRCLIGLGESHTFGPDSRGEWPRHTGDLLAVNGTQVTFVPAPGEETPVSIDIGQTDGIILRYQTPSKTWSQQTGTGVAPSYCNLDGCGGFSINEVLSVLRPGIWMMYVVDSRYMNIVCTASD